MSSTQKMFTLMMGTTPVYVPDDLNNVPCTDWVNFACYMGPDGWAQTEMECEDFDDMSVKDWLAYFTYEEKDTGRRIFNGKSTWPTHLIYKYARGDYFDPDDIRSFFVDSDNDE